MPANPGEGFLESLRNAVYFRNYEFSELRWYFGMEYNGKRMCIEQQWETEFPSFWGWILYPSLVWDDRLPVHDPLFHFGRRRVTWWNKMANRKIGDFPGSSNLLWTMDWLAVLFPKTVLSHENSKIRNVCHKQKNLHRDRNWYRHRCHIHHKRSRRSLPAFRLFLWFCMFHVFLKASPPVPNQQ